MPATPAVLAARDEFLVLVTTIRPDLHRYCARLTGSIIDGEELVQDTLARGFYALAAMEEPPPLRPWLFRIAHNAAVDRLKGAGRRRTELHADIAQAADAFDRAPAVDPAVLRGALARFQALPLTQRNAVILKDVLGHDLEETAEIMGTTVMAVKAALVRGRAKLREQVEVGTALGPEDRARLHRYASLFNHRDWDGLRALIGEECRLELVAKAERRGAAVGQYFGRYAAESVQVREVLLEGRLALAAFIDGAAEPAYFILLEWDGDHIAFIRDYRYVEYIARDAEFVELAPLAEA